jgi:uncharacterized protein YbjT (DUF2867 family)
MNSPHKIAVAGATGSLGRGIMSSLRARGIASVPIIRSSGVDLTTGDGLDEALDGVTAVIDASSKNTTNATAATRFFSAATNNLLAAEGRAGVEHHVAVSIIGAAQIDAAYYAGKAAQERILTARESGWSVLRASQFHEFVEQIIEAGRMGPLQIVPTMRTQPVSIPEVAESLVDIALGDPVGFAPDLAGPREERMLDLVTRYLSAAGIRRRIVEIPLPGRFGRGMRDGTILPGRAARLGTRTFGEWLAA